MDILLRETKRCADFLLSQEATVKWMEDYPHCMYHKWPDDGIKLSDLMKYLDLHLNRGMVPKKKKLDFWSTGCPLLHPFSSRQ